MVELLEKYLPEPKKRGAYKKRKHQ